MIFVPLRFVMTFVAGTSPNNTTAGPQKEDPEIITAVPPNIGPEAGRIFVTTGAGWVILMKRVCVDD